MAAAAILPDCETAEIEAGSSRRRLDKEKART
jgi:hypothetical protein